MQPANSTHLGPALRADLLHDEPLQRLESLGSQGVLYFDVFIHSFSGGIPCQSAIPSNLDGRFGSSSSTPISKESPKKEKSTHCAGDEDVDLPTLLLHELEELVLDLGEVLDELLLHEVGQQLLGEVAQALGGADELGHQLLLLLRRPPGGVRPVVVVVWRLVGESTDT